MKEGEKLRKEGAFGCGKVTGVRVGRLRGNKCDVRNSVLTDKRGVNGGKNEGSGRTVEKEKEKEAMG